MDDEHGIYCKDRSRFKYYKDKVIDAILRSGGRKRIDNVIRLMTLIGFIITLVAFVITWRSYKATLAQYYVAITSPSRQHVLEVQLLNIEMQFLDNQMHYKCEKSVPMAQNELRSLMVKIRNQPDKPDHYSSAAYLFICLQQYDSAAYYWTHAIMLAPNDMFTCVRLNNIAASYFWLGDSHLATSYMDSALRMQPNNLEYLCNYGVALMDDRQLDAASGIFTTALSKVLKEDTGYINKVDGYRNAIRLMRRASGHMNIIDNALSTDSVNSACGK